jgi:signal transduction histidine kinase
MRKQKDSIEVLVEAGHHQYIYFSNSALLTQLKYYPYMQFGVITLFLTMAYLAFSASGRAEQNQIWVGMAKETAHQLGTPLSSIIAWLEILKSRSVDTSTLNEFERDVKRLETITERFSRIGSVPKLEPLGLNDILQESVDYMRSRVSKKVDFVMDLSETSAVQVLLNRSLFEWVIENLCNNAVDAMHGEGRISVCVTDEPRLVCIDISDTGKGLGKSMYKRVFRPGFTTKKKGWGLGLALCKRIIENYHGGKIFVKRSGSDVGTVFRIVLNK